MVRQGPSASPATGPAHDHTLKTAEGHYLLLEASKKRFLSRAEIMSPPLDIAPYPEYCFSLWYLMFGRHTFRLKFKVVEIPEISLRSIDIGTICNWTTLLLSWTYYQFTRLYINPQHKIIERDDTQGIRILVVNHTVKISFYNENLQPWWGSASETAHHWRYHQVTIKRPPNWDGRMVNITIAGVRGLRKIVKIKLL